MKTDEPLVWMLMSTTIAGVLTRVSDSMAVHKVISASHRRVADCLPAYLVFCLSPAGGWRPVLPHWCFTGLAPVTPHPSMP
ncbi:hypothetical protein HAX54_009652 [Datura stramonium]|uniref:Uncharacterized protein n=1 Tax=Datura stramonium TaxID=4076 RepID=A0ABS8TFY0_DATST|nr:hypothetical protein [Datura stramonium]